MLEVEQWGLWHTSEEWSCPRDFEDTEKRGWVVKEDTHFQATDGRVEEAQEVKGIRAVQRLPEYDV